MIRSGVEMSKQQEDFEKLAGDVLSKAQREKGPYRDVLLGIAEAYEALARHQRVFDDWARTYPVTPLARAEPPSPPGASPAVARSASQISREVSVGRPANQQANQQVNQNGRPTRPSAAA